MKRLIITILIVASTIQGNSQKAYQEWIEGLFPANQANTDLPEVLDCAALPISGCGNRIENNIFFPSGSYSTANLQHYFNPFNYQFQQVSLVPHWEVSHGSPNISDGVNYQSPLPFPGAGYVRLAGWNSSVPDIGNVTEGVVQKIPALTLGNKYGLSFFKKLENLAPLSGTNMDRFTIILMHCADYPLIYRPNHSLPPVPANSQVIYCERNVQNTNWQQVFIEFTANAGYDMVWIFANQTELSSQPPTVVLASYPELIGLTGFTAGPAPTPIQPNCTVTIGPAVPNCSVKNAVFTWTDPNGLITTAPANQQIQVDASVAANVGTWTLSMAVPNAINPASNTCNPLAAVSATVNVPSCGQESWPKAYGTSDETWDLMNAYNGNILFTAHGIVSNSQFYNHIGFIPPNSQPFSYTVHYTLPGITNWMNPSYTEFTLRSGIAFTGWGNSFINSTTGNQVSTSFNISNGEKIIAETSNGWLVTNFGNDNTGNLLLRVHSNLGSISLPINTGINTEIRRIIYNLAQDNLIIVSGATGTSVKMWHFDGVSLNQTVNVNSNIAITGSIEIDNQNHVYFIDQGVLKKYEYLLNSIQVVNISGFNNSEIQLRQNPSQVYTEDKKIYFNQSDKYLYYLDFNNTTSKRIYTENITTAPSYLIVGDNVYLSGWYCSFCGQQIKIGNHIFPNINQGFAPVYVTKFNLQTDFERSSLKEGQVIPNFSNLNIEVVPNPSSASIILRIKDGKNLAFPYKLSITDLSLRIFVRKENYYSGNTIDLSNLTPGTYLITVVNKNGESKTATFIKL